MNLISDYEAHKRDEEWERNHATELDEQWRKAKKCPIHKTPFVAGVFWVDLATKEPGGVMFPLGGGCSQCYSEQEKRK